MTNCPLCGTADFYASMSGGECVNSDCDNFSDRHQEIVEQTKRLDAYDKALSQRPVFESAAGTPHGDIYVRTADPRITWHIPASSTTYTFSTTETHTGAGSASEWYFRERQPAAVDPNRRSGRTFRAVAEAVEVARAGKSAVYVVSSREMQQYVLIMLRDMFKDGQSGFEPERARVWYGPANIFVMMANKSALRRFGSKIPLFFDHDTDGT